MITKNEQLRIPSTLMEIDHILGIFSAKGGVGKSVISVNLAKSLVSKKDLK
ncbi:MAG: hypothetical protein Ct9H90mP4_09360 [Gammaproteobacteria bacterium]|nr:MAG: hypothetical protein Ct9H90mP4_09360 [Gammaproteobacteria bacterium]